MTYYDFDGDYANGADGSCQTCGDPTEEPWHLFCPPCFRKEQGWDDEPDEQLEEDVDRIDAVSPVREECPGCGELRVLFPGPDGRRECVDCRRAHR